MRAVRTGMSWAGLLAGPVAWGASTQANYSLVYWQCTHRSPVIPILALCFLAVAAGGGLLSWRAWQRGGASFKPERELSTERFVSALGMMVAALFALIIIMQLAASLILDECIR
jgi:hypothetical protein